MPFFIPIFSFLSVALLISITLWAIKTFNFSNTIKLSQIQDLHIGNIPRQGGLILFFVTLFLGLYFYQLDSTKHTISMVFLGASLFSAIGIFEDFFPDNSPSTRLIVTLLASFVTVIFLPPLSATANVAYLDQLLKSQIILTLFAIIFIAGLTHAYNIIDGLNGLSSGSGLCALLSIIYLSYQTNDFELGYAGIILLSITLGFFIFNFPIAKIFLGDGGAYWIGSSIAILSFLLMTRNPSINIWAILLINFYPFFETIFSIFRKFFIRKVSPFRPDSKHLHMMFYRLCYHKNTSQNKNHIKSIYINPLSSSILLLLPITSATSLIVTYSLLDIQIFLLMSLSLMYIAIYVKLNHCDQIFKPDAGSAYKQKI